MNLYKVLLVDDEEEVREAIARKLDWPALGFQLVGEAGNGEEALELADRLEPDVIMTDIKMPFMDGLTLCRLVRERLPGVRVAIFSGFDEFEYAKEAITQQVEEYILKPIDAGELADVFRRIRTSLDEEIEARRDVERLRSHYEESLPLLRQQLLFELLDGRTGPERMEERAEAYGLELRAESYCVAVIAYRPTGDAQPFGDAALYTVSLRQLINDTLGEQLCYHAADITDRLVLLFLLDGEQAADGARSVMSLLNPLFAITRRLLGLSLSIGVGNTCQETAHIARSYEDARDALEYQLLVEPGQCIYLGDIEPGNTVIQLPDDSYAADIVRQIKIGGEEELREAVNAMVAHLRGQHLGPQQYQIYLLELLTELLKLIRTYRLDPADARQKELLADGVAMNFSDLEEMGSWLFGFCNNLRTLTRRERRDSARMLVDKAKEILAERYMDSELSLDGVCSELGVSPAYFSSLFKKETGLGFVSWLTDLRMEQALELLLGSDDKTYQIAEQVGYVDPNYFSYVFKRKFGSSPSRYRADRKDKA